MNKYIRILLLLPMIFWSSGCGEDMPGHIDVDQEILKVMETHRIPSVVACVVKGDEIVWEGTYGYANIAKEELTHRNNLYTIMSIGKLVLSTAIFQLWENEAIDLQADINQYLPFDIRNPYFPDKKITASMLLNHTSGLAWPENSDGIPDFHHFYRLEEPPLVRDWVPDYILEEGPNYRSSVWKDFQPGEQFLYSNIGTSLLAWILEEITEMDYRDYVRKMIFNPLEMNNTAFRLNHLNRNNLVTPYDDNGVPMNYYTCRHYPAGFISTDIEDFSHFAIAMLNKGSYKGNMILKSSTFLKMIELQDSTSGTANLWVHCLGDCIGHLGGGTGFSTWAEWHLDKDRAMFVFSNKVNSAISPVGEIYELLKYQAFKY
ncbi:MAG: beta-lactamase family protein [Bacteroidia bacterium]|nr:beta-lactamase family protein [Bacteroidia bacterium]